MRILVALGLGILLASNTAWAQAEACKAEAEKYCKDVQTGEGRVLKCLQSHEADLSQECKARLNTIGQFMACIDDVMRLCPNEPPVGADAIKCLRLHETDLSTACKGELRKIRPN